MEDDGAEGNLCRLVELLAEIDKNGDSGEEDGYSYVDNNGNRVRV